MVRKVLAGSWATCVLLALLNANVADAAPADVVLYASDATNLHGNWARVADTTAAGGQKMSSADRGWSTAAAQAAPAHYFDFTFTAPANTPHHIWMRLRAASNSKWNDSLFAQFSDARATNGAPVFALGSTNGLTVNLANDGSGQSLRAWGWKDGAYWLAQVTTVTFATTGTHTLRIQTREDGVQIDQVVLSPSTYLTSAPGPSSNDTKIVPKPIVVPPPPATPVIQTPSNGAIGVTLVTNLAWTAPGATSYDLKFGSANPPPSLAAGLSTASYAPGGLTNGTTYFWQVIARNNGGVTAGPVSSFTTIVAAPATPVVLSPANGATGVAANAILTWSAAGAASYDVNFGTTNPPASAAAGLSAPSYAPAGLTNGTTYFWQVIARNDGGVTPGTVSSFTTIVAAPATPVVLAPANGATGVAANATLTWSAAGAASYDVNFGTTNPPASAAAGLSAPSYAPAGLTNGTTYFWQVIARNDGGVTAGPVSSFTTIVAAPGTPVVLTPANGATGVAANAILTWSAAGATSYDVNFGTTNPPASAVAGLSAASYPPAGLTNGTTYFWQVIARNNGGVTAGPVSSFTTIVAPPATPVVLTPANGATGVAANTMLTWSAAGAASYDVNFGTTNPPASAAVGLSAASYAPAGLINGTTYFWQVVARNDGGVTPGPVSSLTTIVAAPATPVVLAPANGATGVAANATLTWSAAGAASYDVNFGTTNPPASAAVGLSAPSYAPAGLTNSTTYFWQVVARNDGGSTAGPVSSFTTVAPLTVGEIVIYASDIPASAQHGLWTTAADASSPNSVKLVTPDTGAANLNNPLASPIDYVDVTFSAPAGTPYRIWMRMQAAANSKYNDAVWLQFSDARAAGSSIYPIGSTAGLLVNLATDAVAASLNKWGWQNTAYWLAQATTVSFATSGTHTLRVQIREDGVQFDQIVLSPSIYLNASPGLLTNDNTIVSAVTLQPPSAPVSPNPVVAATGVSIAPALTWSAAGAVSYDVRFGTGNPPADVAAGQANATYSPPQLSNGATYYWQIVARNAAGATTGPVWSFTTVAGGTSGTTWNVPAGGDLQATINNAQPGDTILLQAGATFTGNFVLRAKTGNAVITIRSSASDAQLPGPDTRITPAHAALLPKLKSPTVAAALRTDPGAHHYRLMFLEFPPTYQGYYDIMQLGDGSSAQNTLSMVPYEPVIDHVYIHGDPVYGQKRGIALNSASTTITNSYIAEIRAIGQDSQAIGGVNGPGPFTIVNNYLEAAGENIMIGGSDPAIANLVPSDIIVRGNHLYKPLAWRSQTQWTVKNLFELKNAQRVVVDGNIMENNWLGGQSGYAVLFTPRNQNGGCPWCVVQDVQFTNNIVRNAAGGVNILGRDNLQPSLETNNIVIRNNLFENISGTQFGGQGRFLLMTGGGRDYTFDHNTVLQDGWTAVYVGHPVQNLVFKNNIIPDYSWAIMGDGQAPGNATITAFFPNAIFLGNIFAGSNQSKYPAGNHYPASLAAVGFVNYVPLTGGNYRLALTSLYLDAGNDGTDVGVDIDALNLAAGTLY